MKKMKGKVIALFATLAFILVFVSSINVVTLFQGSHEIKDITSPGNDILCKDCHERIYNELLPENSSIHENFNCEECHRLQKTADERTITHATSNSTGWYSGNESHACYTPRCLDCHGGTATYNPSTDRWETTYHNDTGEIKHAPVARAFNESPPEYGTDYSAHKQFVKQSSSDFDMSVGENEACIACHTNYSIEIEYSYFWNIEYTLNNWDFGNSFRYNGTRYNTSSKSESGAKHEFINTSDINCISCHKNIYDALVTGTDGGTNEDFLTHSPIEIYTSGDHMSDWDTDNPWGHYRYHYIPAPATNRAIWVNNSYCYKCHNVNKYANDNHADSTTYNLTNVTDDTNSTLVHCAEALTCQTCHGSEKTKKVKNNPDFHQHSGHTGTGFVDTIANTYARTFHGDICMGCHEAALHPSSGQCDDCHKHGRVNVYIESEPSGYAENT